MEIKELAAKIPTEWFEESRGKNGTWLTLKVAREFGVPQGVAFAASMTARRNYLVATGKVK